MSEAVKEAATWLRDLIDDWWRIDPAGIVYAVGLTLAVLLGAITFALLLHP